MKKILYVFGSLLRGGSQLRTLEVCRALQRRFNVQFDFCDLSNQAGEIEEEIKELGGKIYHLPIKNSNFIWRFCYLLNQQQYQVIESHPNLFSGIILPLAKLCKVPIRISSWRNSLGSFDGLVSNKPFIWLMRTLIKKNATHIVSVSRSALDDAFPPVWQSSVDCRVIYNGLSYDRFQKHIDRNKLRAMLGWPPDSKIIINVARFTQQKNHKAIIEATRLAYEISPNIRLLLVGDGSFRNEINGLISQYDLQDICTVTGTRTDIPELLLGSDVFLFPSLWEGLPGALLEALASGLPAVTSDISPIREIAEHFPKSILMARPNNCNKHAEHILKALMMPNNREELQNTFTRTPFILEYAVNAYASLYDLTGKL